MTLGLAPPSPVMAEDCPLIRPVASPPPPPPPPPPCKPPVCTRDKPEAVPIVLVQPHAFLRLARAVDGPARWVPAAGPSRTAAPDSSSHGGRRQTERSSNRIFWRRRPRAQSVPRLLPHPFHTLVPCTHLIPWPLAWSLGERCWLSWPESRLFGATSPCKREKRRFAQPTSAARSSHLFCAGAAQHRPMPPPLSLF